MTATSKFLVKDLGISADEDRPLINETWEDVTDQVWHEDPLVALVAIAELKDRLATNELHFVRKARKANCSWDAIAKAMGKNSRTQVWRKYALHMDEIPPIPDQPTEGATNFLVQAQGVSPMPAEVIEEDNDEETAQAIAREEIRIAESGEEDEHRHGYWKSGDY